MKIACIGDSLTEGDYGVSGKVGIANVHKENYPYFLAKMTGDTVLNFGKCGARAGTYLSQYEKLNPDLSDVSLVLVMLGTNGGFDKDADTPDNRAFETLLARLHQDAPHARILLCTPPHVTENPALSGCGLSARVEKAWRMCGILPLKTTILSWKPPGFRIFAPKMKAFIRPTTACIL